MTRPMTAPELAYLRTDGQVSRLGLVILNPEVVFAAEVNGVPESDDQVNTVPYKNVSFGVPANAKNGMTMWVGTSPGEYDSGMVRVVGTSGSQIDIAPTSEITWEDGLYISVVNEYGFWPRQANLVNGIFYCDDVSIYTDQHGSGTQKPVPIMGPDQVLYLSGSSVQAAFNASESWVLGTSTIASHSWSVSGSASISGSASGSPVITFTAPGTYVVDDIVTTDGGRSTTGHRTVYVYSEAVPPINQFEVVNIQGDANAGGWTFGVRMYDQVDLSLVRDRARVHLITQDYYQSGSGSAVTLTPVNLGPISGLENIICSGWINGETIQDNPEMGTVSFTVNGPHTWMDKLGSWPAGIRNVNGEPANWNEYKNFVYDAFLWHEITWRSTVAEVIDVFRSEDTKLLVGGTGGWGTIWSQIKQMGENQLFISPRCNRYGQLYVQKDTNYLPADERTGIPVIMAVEKVDWQDTLEIERRVVPDVGFVDVTGQAWTSAGGTKPKRAGSWGTSVGRFGRMENRTNIMLHAATDAEEQEELNEMAGILLGYFNNPYPRISIKMASNNRFFDIAPRQFGKISVAATDTPRGLVLTDQKFIPRTIAMEWDAESGTVFTNITAEAESTPEHGFYLPIYTGPPITSIPRIPRTPWRKKIIKKPPFPSSVTCLSVNAGPAGPYNLYLNTVIQTAGGGVTYYDKPLHCRIRPSTSVNKTTVRVSYTSYGTSSSGSSVSDWALAANAVNMQVWALDMSGSPVLQGTADAYSGAPYGLRSFVFAPAVSTEISGFRFVAVNSTSEVILKTFDFSQDTSGWVPTIHAPVYQYVSGSGGDLRIGLTGPVPAGSFGSPSSSTYILGPVFDTPLLTSSLTRIRVYSHYGQFTPGDVNMSYQIYYFWDPATPSPGYNYAIVAVYAPGFRTDDLNGTSRIDTFTPLYTGVYLNKLAFEGNWASQGSGYLGTSGTYGALDKVEILNAGVTTYSKDTIDAAFAYNICNYFDPG